MIATNYSQVRDNKNVVMISEEAYHNMLENMHLMGNKANYAWLDSVYWQTEDRKTLKKINQLFKDISRNGNRGIGKPEPLTGNLSGFWSRRLDKQNRLVYKIDVGAVMILSCRYH